MQEAVVTRQGIVSGLRQLGLKAGAIVEVHSSLSAFGCVEGGAETIITALLDVVGPQGTIVMSAYLVSPAVPLTEEEQARGITWKVRILAEDTPEKTGMGAVADMFRQREDVVSGHGVHRTCAWGHEAERHCQGYDYLLEKEGEVLLLGVAIDRCSSLHAAESVPLPPEIEAYGQIPEDIHRDYDPRHWGIGYGDAPGDAWGKVYAEADRRGLIRHHRIGQAACLLFKARSLVDIYAQWRRDDPFGLYGVPRPE